MLTGLDHNIHHLFVTKEPCCPCVPSLGYVLSKQWSISCVIILGTSRLSQNVEKLPVNDTLWVLRKFTSLKTDFFIESLL